MATFSIHFDGPITIEHKLTIRTLANTYEHMQRAIDRAYLIERYGNAWKHARLKANQYRETDFIALYPREGGIVLDAVRNGAGQLIDRIASSIRPVFESATQHGLEQHASIVEQLSERRLYVNQMRENTITFEQVKVNPPLEWASAYSNRSVVKEIDQIVSQVAPARHEGSVVDITLHGDHSHLPFTFTPEIARRFHKIASQRELGPPMIITAQIRSLDRGNKHTPPSAKLLNRATSREVSLQLANIQELEQIRPYHDGNDVRLFVSPVVEALGFDLNGGDLVFLAVV